MMRNYRKDYEKQLLDMMTPKDYNEEDKYVNHHNDYNEWPIGHPHQYLQ